MEGPYIEIKTDHDRSDPDPDKDNLFGWTLKRLREDESSFAFIFTELARSETKKAIIENALSMLGTEWSAFLRVDDADVMRDFGQLIAHWDTPFNGEPKTLAKHKEEVDEFVQKLKPFL